MVAIPRQKPSFTAPLQQAMEQPTGAPAGTETQPAAVDSQEFLHRMTAQTQATRSAHHTRIIEAMAGLSKPYSGSTDPSALAQELFNRTFDQMGTDHDFVNLAFQMANTQGTCKELNDRLAALITDPKAQAQVQKLELHFPGQGALQYLIEDELSGLKKKHAQESLDKGEINYATDGRGASALDGAENAVLALTNLVKENPAATVAVVGAVAAAPLVLPAAAANAVLGAMAWGGAAVAAYQAGSATIDVVNAERSGDAAKTNQAYSEAGGSFTNLGIASIGLKGAGTAASGAASTTQKAIEAKQSLTVADDVTRALPQAKPVKVATAQPTQSTTAMTPSASTATQSATAASRPSTAAVSSIKPTAATPIATKSLKPEIVAEFRSEIAATKRLTETSPLGMNEAQLNQHLNTLFDREARLKQLIEHLSDFQKKADALDPQSRAQIRQELSTLWHDVNQAKSQVFSATEKARSTKPVRPPALDADEALRAFKANFESNKNEWVPLAQKDITYLNKAELDQHAAALGKAIERLSQQTEPLRNIEATSALQTARNDAHELHNLLLNAQVNAQRSNGIAGFKVNQKIAEVATSFRDVMRKAEEAIKDPVPHDPRNYIASLDRQLTELQQLSPSVIGKPFLNQSNGSQTQQAVDQIAPALKQTIERVQQAKERAQVRLQQFETEVTARQKANADAFAAQEAARSAARTQAELVATKGYRFTNGVSDTMKTLSSQLRNALHSAEPEADKLEAVKNARRYLEHDWKVLKGQVSKSDLGQFQNAYSRASNEILRHEKDLGIGLESTPKLPEQVVTAKPPPLNDYQARELLNGMTPEAKARLYRDTHGGQSPGRVSLEPTPDDLQRRGR